METIRISMTLDARASLLEEEILIVRHSGEIPEIALYSSIFYLTEDPEGPGMSLLDHEIQALYDAALERAREIVLRDLEPANRDLGLYRGPARTIYNWYRLRNLCKRINRSCPGFSDTVARALICFLQTEVDDVRAKKRCSSVNCSEEELRSFCEELSIELKSLPQGWDSLCQE